MARDRPITKEGPLPKSKPGIKQGPEPGTIGEYSAVYKRDISRPSAFTGAIDRVRDELYRLLSTRFGHLPKVLYAGSEAGFVPVAGPIGGRNVVFLDADAPNAVVDVSFPEGGKAYLELIRTQPRVDARGTQPYFGYVVDSVKYKFPAGMHPEKKLMLWTGTSLVLEGIDGGSVSMVNFGAGRAYYMRVPHGGPGSREYDDYIYVAESHRLEEAFRMFAENPQGYDGYDVSVARGVGKGHACITIFGSRGEPLKFYKIAEIRRASRPPPQGGVKYSYGEEEIPSAPPPKKPSIPPAGSSEFEIDFPESMKPPEPLSFDDREITAELFPTPETKRRPEVSLETLGDAEFVHPRTKQKKPFAQFARALSVHRMEVAGDAEIYRVKARVHKLGKDVTLILSSRKAESLADLRGDERISFVGGNVYGEELVRESEMQVLIEGVPHFGYFLAKRRDSGIEVDAVHEIEVNSAVLGRKVILDIPIDKFDTWAHLLGQGRQKTVEHVKNNVLGLVQEQNPAGDAPGIVQKELAIAEITEKLISKILRGDPYS